ncbi:MAG: hypothetical protein NVSMB21_09750 [Vulcanimicrobiaceae bacterium]
MIVAMLAMLTMDVALDDVVDMPVVRDRDVLAADAMNVARRVRAARVRRIARRHDVGSAELVFVDVVAVRMVEVRVMHVVDVIAMTDCEMTALRAVDVIVAVVNVRFHTRSPRRTVSLELRARTKPSMRP